MDNHGEKLEIMGFHRERLRERDRRRREKRQILRENRMIFLTKFRNVIILGSKSLWK